jgi:hypothetical protein
VVTRSAFDSALGKGEVVSSILPYCCDEVLPRLQRAGVRVAD